MRRMMLFGAVCLAAAAAFAAAGPWTQTQSKKPDAAAAPARTDVKMALVPLNVKTGLWQMTQTVTWKNLPPQMAPVMQNAVPVTYKSCVKPNDLITNPWANPHDKCNWTVLNSNGTDMEVRGTCGLGENYGTLEAHGKIHVVDPENGTGSMAVILTGNGQTMNGNASYTGKWIGATCPAVMN